MDDTVEYLKPTFVKPEPKAKAKETETVAISSKESLITDSQKALRALGYSCKVDGIEGPVTTNAIKRFQSSKRIKVDGILGTKTSLLLLGK